VDREPAPAPERAVDQDAAAELSMLERTMSMPTPRPDMSETALAVEKPDAKIRLSASRSFRASAAAWVTTPFFTAAALIRAGSMPLPSSLTSITMWFSSWRADRSTRPRAGFPAAARRRGLDAVVDGVAQQVDQRVAQRLQDGAVELGFAAGHLEVDLLPVFWARSRTMRGIRWNTPSIGSIRAFMISSCSSLVIRAIRCVVSRSWPTRSSWP
jgi:hypothetical protein